MAPARVHTSWVRIAIISFLCSVLQFPATACHVPRLSNVCSFPGLSDLGITGVQMPLFENEEDGQILDGRQISVLLRGFNFNLALIFCSG